MSDFVTTHTVPQVLGLANRSAIDGVNCARTDAPSLVRIWDFVVLPAVCMAMAVGFGDIGAVLFVPAAVTWLLTAGMARVSARRRRAWQVDRVIDLETWWTSRQAVTLL